MSFGDFFVQLIKFQHEIGIKKALKHTEKDVKKIIVNAEDCILNDKEFENFMKENEYLIYENNKGEDENDR